MNRLKFDKMKKRKKRHQFILKMALEHKRRSFINFCFKFEYRKYHTIKGTQMDSLKMSKYLIEILTTQERHKSHTCALSSLTVSVCVGSSDLVGSC
jgi:hypothetical protein